MIEEQRNYYIRGRRALFASSGVGGTCASQGGQDGPNNYENGQDISSSGSDWGKGFQPREKIEIVRNCAALPRDFVDAVVLKVAKYLLSLTERNTENSEWCDMWNTGGKNRFASVSTGRAHVT